MRIKKKDKILTKESFPIPFDGTQAAKIFLEICQEEYNTHKINYLYPVVNLTKDFNTLCNNIKKSDLPLTNKKRLLAILKIDTLEKVDLSKLISKNEKIRTFTKNLIIAKYRKTLQNL